VLGVARAHVREAFRQTYETAADANAVRERFNKAAKTAVDGSVNTGVVEGDE
jgi:hypothetical protein